MADGSDGSPRRKPSAIGLAKLVVGRHEAQSEAVKMHILYIVNARASSVLRPAA